MAKISVFTGLLAMGAILTLHGCGGSGSSTPSTDLGLIHFTGAATTSDTSNGTVTVPAAGGVRVTMSSGLTAVVPSGAVPAGTVLPAGTQFVIIPAGVGFAGSIPMGTQLLVNGVAESGASFTLNGLLTSPIALPVTPGTTGASYTLSFPTQTLMTNRVLTIHQTVFQGKFYIIISGGHISVISPVPTSLNGTIPNNGQNAVGSHVLSTFGGGNNGRSAHLMVDYGTGFQLNQGKTIASLQANFTDLSVDSQNVPNNGVQLVKYVIGDLP